MSESEVAPYIGDKDITSFIECKRVVENWVEHWKNKNVIPFDVPIVIVPNNGPGSNGSVSGNFNNNSGELLYIEIKLPDVKREDGEEWVNLYVAYHELGHLYHFYRHYGMNEEEPPKYKVEREADLFAINNLRAYENFSEETLEKIKKHSYERIHGFMYHEVATNLTHPYFIDHSYLSKFCGGDDVRLFAVTYISNKKDISIGDALHETAHLKLSKRLANITGTSDELKRTLNLYNAVIGERQKKAYFRWKYQRKKERIFRKIKNFFLLKFN